MPAKLIITKDSDSSWNHEREFGQELITIGRDSSNTLLLEDSKKIVSRRHAQLRLENGRYTITDCGSHNFTFVNNEKIARNIPHALESGDKIKIGEYTLQYVSVEADEQKEATVVMVNPYYEEMKIMSGLIKKIKRKYETAEASHRDEDLKQAMEEMLAQVEPGAIGPIIARELAGGKLAAPAAPEAPAAAPAPAAPAAAMVPDVVAPMVPAENGNPLTSTEIMMGVSSESVLMMRIAYTMDALLKSVIKIVKASRRFRREHIGIQVGEGGVNEIEVHMVSAEELKEYMLSPEIDEEEARRRFQIVRSQIDDSVSQYASLLNLYGVSLNDEVRRILESIDPAKIQYEYTQQSAVNRMLPILTNKKVVEYLKQKVQEMLQEGTNLFETDTFKPLFEHAFMKELARQ